MMFQNFSALYGTDTKTERRPLSFYYVKRPFSFLYTHDFLQHYIYISDIVRRNKRHFFV